jgi:peptidoglycan/xylan/chitin deacetylase (PgdA/CDA1 family)
MALRPVAVVLALVLAACGSTATETTVSTTTTATTSTTPTTTTTTTVPPAPATTTTVAPSGPAQLVVQGDPSARVVALTFDAGSDTGNAAAILDALAANGIRAAFGLTGKWVRANPDLVGRMAAEGHLLVNHTDGHRSFTGASTGAAPLDRVERWRELDRAEASISAATGATSVPWFRPPYGDRDRGVDADVGARGYRYELLWTVDSLGWKGLPAADVVARCLGRAEPGAIYLLHVGAASTDADALQPLIDALRAAGYGFARVDRFAG